MSKSFHVSRKAERTRTQFAPIAARLPSYTSRSTRRLLRALTLTANVAAVLALLDGAAIASPPNVGVAAGDPVPHGNPPDDHVTLSSSDTGKALARHESGNPVAANTIYYRITLCKGAGPNEYQFRPPTSDLKSAGLKGGPEQVGKGASSDNTEKGGATGLFNGDNGALQIRGDQDGVLTWQLKDGNGNTATFKLRVHFVDCDQNHGAHSGSKNPHEKEISMNLLEGQGADEQQYASRTATGGGAFDASFQGILDNASFNGGPFFTAASNRGSYPFGGSDGTKVDCTFDIQPPTLQLDESDVQSVSGDIAQPSAHDVQSVGGDLGQQSAGGDAAHQAGAASWFDYWQPSEAQLKVMEAYEEMRLRANDFDRLEFLKDWQTMPPGLKKFIAFDTSMTEFQEREDEIKENLSGIRAALAKTAGSDHKVATSDAQSTPSSQKPDNTTPPSDNKPTTDNSTPPSDSKPGTNSAPTDNPASNTPNAPSGGTPTTTTTQDQGTPTNQTASDQPYNPIEFKKFTSVKPGEKPQVEPGKQISWFAQKEEPDLSKKPQKGASSDPVTCTTNDQGTCQTKIATDELQTYRMKPDKVQYTFTSMLRRGGYNEVTGGKLDPKQTFGSTLNLVEIGEHQFARYTWSSFYGTGDGYPTDKGFRYIVDPCLFMLPAPWGADFNQPPAHSDLPAGALTLSPAAGIVQ